MKLCHMMAIETLKNHEIHYHGAIEDPQLEFLENYAGKSGFFIKKFLINDKLNLNKWGVTWDAIQKDVYNFIGKPVVLTPKRDHPKVYEQETFKVGEIIDVGIDELLHSAWQVSQITDKKAQKLIRQKKVKFGSPTVLVYSPETVEKKNIGTNIEETWLHRFIPAHDGLIAEPAYGRMIDFIPAICDGDGPACALKLSEVSADVNSDNTDQLTIVPFVKSTMKKKFKAETFNEIVGYIQQADESKLGSCVERKIKILAEEHPKWDNDQVVAVAFSYCRKKSGELEAMILQGLTSEILTMRDKALSHKKLETEITSLTNKLQTIKA